MPRDLHWAQWLAITAGIQFQLLIPRPFMDLRAVGKQEADPFWGELSTKGWETIVCPTGFAKRLASRISSTPCLCKGVRSVATFTVNRIGPERDRRPNLELSQADL